MTYKVTLKKRAIKALQNINEPYYTNIKSAIYSLANNPRPPGIYKAKGKKWLSNSSGRLSDYLRNF